MKLHNFITLVQRFNFILINRSIYVTILLFIFFIFFIGENKRKIFKTIEIMKN